MIRRLLCALAALLPALLLAAPAGAALPRAALEQVRIAPPPHARWPAALRLRDMEGRPASPLAADGRGPPVLLVFADYGCATLCGPALAIVGSRLEAAALRPGRDYRLAVAGLDPASTPAQARAFAAGRLPATIPAELFTGDAPAIRAAAAALGYGYVRDPATGAFAHPVAAFVLTADGRLSRVLSEIALTPGDLRAALAAARAGAAPGVLAAAAIACHGALEALGRFDAPAIAGLRLGGAAVVIGGAGLLLLATRRRRERAA